MQYGTTTKRFTPCAGCKSKSKCMAAGRCLKGGK